MRAPAGIALVALAATSSFAGELTGRDDAPFFEANFWGTGLPH